MAMLLFNKPHANLTFCNMTFGFFYGFMKQRKRVPCLRERERERERGGGGGGGDCQGVLGDHPLLGMSFRQLRQAFCKLPGSRMNPQRSPQKQTLCKTGVTRGDIAARLPALTHQRPTFGVSEGPVGGGGGGGCVSNNISHATVAMWWLIGRQNGLRMAPAVAGWARGVQDSQLRP